MNAECSFLDFPSAKTVSDLIKCSQEDNDNTIDLKASIDGKQLTNLEHYRVMSSLFNITIPQNNVTRIASGQDPDDIRRFLDVPKTIGPR